MPSYILLSLSKIILSDSHSLQLIHSFVHSPLKLLFSTQAKTSIQTVCAMLDLDIDFAIEPLLLATFTLYLNKVTFSTVFPQIVF